MRLRDLFGSRRTALQPDGFPLNDKHHNAECHALLSDYLREGTSARHWFTVEPRETRSGQAIFALDLSMQAEMVRAVMQRIRHIRGQGRQPWDSLDYTAYRLLVSLLSKRLPLLPADVVELISIADNRPFNYGSWRTVLRTVENHVKASGLTPEIQRQLARWGKTDDGSADDRARAERIRQILGDAAAPRLAPGEPWAERVQEDLSAMDTPVRGAWEAVLAHARSANGSQPSRSWLKKAGERLTALGPGTYTECILRWFPECSRIPDRMFHAGNSDVLRGLVWMGRLVEDPRLPGAVADLAEAAYRKIPGEGARSAKVGNACINTLGAMEGMDAVAQLERLRRRVKYRVAVNLIESAFHAAAVRAGLSPEELEELAVPTAGLEEVGYRRAEIGGCVAEMRLGTGKPAWSWSRGGRPLASVPSAVKEGFASEVKALKDSADELAKLLPAQRERLERLLVTERRWALPTWRERYLDHPLVGFLARRLIWHFQDPHGRSATCIWQDGSIVDVRGRHVDWLGPETEVALWHPIGTPAETVLAWRVFLEDNGVTQPFKQAHREVYILTDAELRTGTYSNRFAAHILRQHQFNALCRQRGWRYSLQGAFDSPDETATLDLPSWELRAEFWTDRPWNDANLDEAITEAGIFLHVFTDQVRFTDMTGAPRPLTEVPALVFSEVMRDVDLFVGVASVGNDPTWADRGEIPANHYAYWSSYSFGDLGASAESRRDVLTRLIPRLRIADRCTLNGRSKFLVVRGDLRTYKIHLGSGNILMEPNDQYLCIVPDRSKGKGNSDVFLPFEGDAMLSVILSKAFLLANDRAITDQTITRQIQR